MNHLTHADVTALLLAISVLLLSARALGEFFQRLKQPAILGELIAGILLGPTVLGALYPELQTMLFPDSGPVAIALEAFTTISITLFLFIAGMEVDLSTVWKQGKSTIAVSVLGLVVPFAVGWLAAFFFPYRLGFEGDLSVHVFAMFFATALSITALPVIVKILMDLNMFRSDLGMIIVGAAVVNDLLGWLIFAVILSLMAGGNGHAMAIETTILLTLGLAAVLLTVGRWLIEKLVVWAQAYLSWPGGIIGFSLGLSLLFAALTEAIGIHAIFGAFLFGVAFGENRHLREHTKAILDRFVSFFFAPIFFAGIGLKVNFLTGFDVGVVVVVLVLASVGKIYGAMYGAKLAGIAKQEAYAIGFAMNARGAMEIILGMLALQAGLIGEKLFVALVVMALATSMTSGTLMQRMLKSKKPLRLLDVLVAKRFAARLKALSPEECIQELVDLIGTGERVTMTQVAEEVLAREKLLPTGLENGVAVPHARLAAVVEPIVCVGISEEGVDFDAPDGQKANLVFLLVTPADKHASQLELLADIAKTFSSRAVVEQAMESRNFTEFLAHLRSPRI